MSKHTTRHLSPFQGQDTSVSDTHHSICLEDDCDWVGDVYYSQRSLEYATSDADNHARRRGHRTSVHKSVTEVEVWVVPIPDPALLAATA